MAFDFEGGELLLIDKPIEWTSFDAVNFIRSFLKHSYKIKKLKVGHAGTLDPLATGLLLVCTGKKTKTIQDLQDMDKVYTGTILLGQTTPSYDLESEPDAFYSTENITEAAIEAARLKFIGTIEQVPPIFSAIKIDGKRAFLYARKNQDVTMIARKITISNFEITKVNLPEIEFRVDCSKGTYIRSLVHDFGAALNNGACLKSLRRTRIGNYAVEDSLTIDRFRELVLQEQTLNNS
ncbi:MAG: tRNA pseudouridine(55) synthase TruB [Bacteroidales bacterium]|nr:tRNA pseudouridine(55) synthase TruB [Bacteroidales bacterium]